MQGPRLDALTGMRGLASLMVVGYHAVCFYWIWQLESGLVADAFEHPLSAWGFGGGWLGVDFFFVLSGFLLAGPLLRQARMLPSWLEYRLFAAKRLLRLAPPYYLSFAVVYALAGWSGHALFDFTRDSLTTHLLYVHTFFPDHQFAINGVAWTLAVELQFYLLLPLLVIPFRRFGPATAVAFAALSLAYLAWSHDPADPWNNRFLAFQFPAFLGHFGFGIAAASLLQRGWRPRVQADLAIASSLAILVVAPALYLGYTTQFEPIDVPLYHLGLRMAAGLAFALVILFALEPASRIGRALTSRPLLWAGEISYSLYLLHYAVAGSFLVAGADWAFQLGLPSFTFLVAIVALVLSTGFYFAVERPSLQLKDAAARRLSGL